MDRLINTFLKFFIMCVTNYNNSITPGADKLGRCLREQDESGD
jgi:hypothetical protein